MKTKKSGCSRWRVKTEICRPVSQAGRMNQLDTGLGGACYGGKTPHLTFN